MNGIYLTEEEELDDNTVSLKLREKLSINVNPSQLILEFKRYKKFVERPKVSFDLRANRENFLLVLIQSLTTYKNNLLDRNFKTNDSISSLSDQIKEIYYAKQIGYKLSEVRDVIHILSDLPDYKTLIELLESITTLIQEFEKDSLKMWVEDVQTQMSLDSMSLKVDENVIHFNEITGFMQVNYTSTLSLLIEDAHQLETLNFRLPQNIKNLVDAAKKYMQQGRELDQIASFHNTIGERIINSQKPMLLDSATELARLVQQQYNIPWSNEKAVEDYCTKLIKVVRDLGKKNNYLAMLHIKIKKKIITLFDLDMVTKSQEWKGIVQEVKDIIQQCEAKGYKNTIGWKRHWDLQLYKAFEVQYIKGLENLNSRLPQIAIEILYRENRLQFKPQLEDVRTKYYTILRRYLTIPQRFTGILDDDPANNIFPNIVTTNAHRFPEIYNRSELQFKKISELAESYREWVAIGASDIEDSLRKYLITASDWDKNFRIAKSNGQEIARLSFADQIIGCFKITFGLLRNDIELLNRRYWDLMVALLRESIVKNMSELEMFFQDGVQKLRSHPQSVEEITKAKVVKDELSKKDDYMQKLFNSINEKNQVMTAWSKERVDTSRLQSLRENFMALLQNHEFVLGRQMESVKIMLTGQITQFETDLENFKIHWDELKPKEHNIASRRLEVDDMIKYITSKRGDWLDLMQRKHAIKKSCNELGVEGSEFPTVDEVENDLEDQNILWRQVKEFDSELNNFQDEDWIIFRTKPHRFEEFLQNWEDKFREGGVARSVLIITMLREIDDYKAIIPHVKLLRGDTFADKHWYELYQLLQIPSKPAGLLKFGDFLTVRDKISEKYKEIKDLNAKATGEITVRQALNELDVWEIEAKFTILENIDSQGQPIFIIDDFKNILNKVGDNQSLLQSIKTSPFYTNFADRITVWETRLVDLDEYLVNLNKIQRRWVYLEPILSHGVLDNEQRRFQVIDEEYRSIMQILFQENRVLTLLKIPNLKSRLSSLVDQLARCQNSLNEFLERKRSSFPRFYFIGDDDLLEILGQSTKPNVIQAHLKKLFAGIYNVDFDKNFKKIIAMKSLEGEVVPLKTPVTITNNVEEWLSELSNEMKYTLKSCLLDCVAANNNQNDQQKSPDNYPAQVLLLCNSIIFTDRCEDAIRNGKLKELLTETKTQLDTYTNVIIPENHQNPIVLELKLKDLILDIIHEIYVIEYLIAQQIRNVNDWSWQKQLRFYIRDDGCATVKMADAEFMYSYEYQGNSPKLVHTPLTDKCYLTLTQGMRNGLGGNPYGPAGTGKTESVKALGGLMGRQVLVFNCDEGIDVKAMGRIFIGLAKCGAWGCFDEFNRLDGATLSAISMQIEPIQTALKNGHKTVQLLDEIVPLDPSAGIFVTLNPAGKGYGGRNKLPDNLKQLFRPVVMSSPDNDLISEVILHTEGFKEAAKLGSKLVETFNLSSKLLSTQKHYDWGLRALKTVLKGCGSALKEYKKASEEVQKGAGDAKIVVTEKDETDIVVASLRLNTLPKLTYADTIRFDQLIKDIFSNVTFKDLGHEELKNNLKQVANEKFGQVNANQIRKCLELYEQLKQRMGVVIVGPPCCGKSTIWMLLKAALLKMDQAVKIHVINPKCMSRSHLLGHINLDTRQWTDGVLTLKAQQVYAEPANITSWIICDGDIDPEWVESLNSVLDDNRLLTLPSGWRIKFGPNVNFIFETHDLSFASPATISRMGMIFMSDEDADIKGVIHKWIEENVKPELKSLLTQYIDDYFYKALNWVSQQSETTVHLPTISIVKNTLAQMKGITTIQEFVVAMVRGTSVHLIHDNRIEFVKQLLSWTGQTISTTLIEADDILNIYYESKSNKLQVYQDQDLIPGTTFDLNEPPLVYTANVKQTIAQVKPLLSNSESFMLIGPEGCGKTTILENAFKDLRSTEVATIYCSSLISSNHLLQKLAQVCITTSTTNGRAYTRKGGGNLVLYFKDLNLVKPDKWKTCSLVEFLLQILTYKGFYDLNLDWIELQDVQIVVSVTLIGTKGRYNLSSRFLSNMRLCVVEQPNKKQLNTIYENYYSTCLQNNYPDHPLSSNKSQIQKLTQATINFYDLIGTTFLEVQHGHYKLTTRDLTNLVCGIMRYDLGPVEQNDFQDFIGVWAYEASRLFSDKLVSAEDRVKFDSILDSTVKTEWNIIDISKQVKTVFYSSGLALGNLPSTSPAKTSNSSAKPGQRRRQSQIRTTCKLTKVSLDEFQKIVERGISTYSRENGDLEIVLFPEVLENVGHFDRILSLPGASLVSIGRSGIGRRTALCIVSALHSVSLLTLKVGRNYTMKHFKNDLKSLIQTAAVEGNKVFFLVEDFQLIENEFLDMINGLLSTGEVPGLYTAEELEAVLSQLRENAASDGYQSSLYSYFAKRIREFIHIVLMMDYTNPNFKSRCESNPAIYKQCSLVWLDIWSSNTLQLLPKLILNKFGQSEDKIEDNKTKSPRNNTTFIQHFRNIYDSLDSTLNTPRRYLAFIHTYAAIFSTRRNLVLDKIKKLKAGIAKLQGARDVVEKLKSEAAIQEVTLAEKQAAANNALEQITATMQSANFQRLEMEDLREKTMKENEILLEKKRSIDEELKEIEPLIQQARSSVGNIKTEALAEIRSLRAPPDVIRDILEAVLRLMGVMDTSWNSMKAFLSQRGVKEEIRTFDADNIKHENRAAVQKLLNERGESFELKNAKRASAAAAPLAEWVVANVKYSLVLEKIQPLAKQQKALEKNLQMAENQLGHLSTELMSVDERVQQLKGSLNQYTKEAAEIEVHLAGAKKTLVSAEKLVGKLLDEFGRWNTDLNTLIAELELLPIKCLLSSAFVSYLSDATEDSRVKYMNKWKSLAKVNDFDFLEFISTEKEKLQNQALGLPSEQLSHENASIILNRMNGNPGITCLRPLLIDPSGRATEWLYKYLSEKNSSVVLISLRDPKFPTEFELAIRFGKSLIIQEADEIEPVLIPVLRGDLISQGSRELIQLGDKYLDYNMDFKIFLSTRNPNPAIPPDVSSIITLINFTTTRAGLVTQLLTTTLSLEKPELEKKKSKLLKKSETLKIDLEAVSETLLQDLANSQGNILENQELLNSLNETKVKSIDILNSLKESEMISDSLNKEVNVYAPLAEFGSKLYFTIIEAHKLNSLYKFSLSSFLNLFTKNLESRSADTSTESRMVFLQAELENSTFDYVCRSLFKSDRLAFALHFAHMMHSEYFKTDEWDAFTGQLLADVKGSSARNRQDPIPNWIAEDRTLAVQLLRANFPNLYEQLELSNTEMWSEFIRNPECEKEFPSNVKQSLTSFEHVMLIQSLRPDRLHTQMTIFACKALGRKSLFPPPTNFRELLPGTRSTEPILILISSGADPSQELKELADATVGKDNYSEISMGQGQFNIALDKLSEASREGTWLCLKNLHLVTYWLQTLEKEIQRLNPHAKFRLWLTAEPYEEFPVVLAESCLKIAYEAPQGLKKNLQRTFANWPKLFVVGDKNILRMQALFALAFFHAVVQERRTYIAQGWSKFYEFNESDLRAGADVLDRIFKSTRSKDIQWAYVQGLFENTIYGGRVDNEFDNRVLVSYLNKFFSENLLTGNKSSGKTICEGITMPSSANYQDYVNVIENLLDFDKPTYFGLPSNIERSWQRSTSSQVINQLKLLSRTFNTDIKFNRNVWSMELTPMLNMWKRINQTHNTTNLLQIKIQPPNISEAGESDPIQAFVKLEYFNAITFVKNVHKSLAAISKVIRGTNIPSTETISIANSLLKRETPSEWQQEWEGPTDPLLYLQGILKHIVAIQSWVPLAERGRFLDEPIKLSDSLHPESFLCAFKQQCARKLKIPLDDLILHCAWNRSSVPSNTLTCKMTGLLLEGCSFDGSRLIENTSESSPITKIPDCTIAWIAKTDFSKLRRASNSKISIPFYSNESREKLIGSLDFPSSGDNVKWIQAGVGVFLQN